MPLLKFRCTSCHHVFDALISVRDMDSAKCEHCGQPVERAYEGACLFGMSGSTAGRGGSCSGHCETCGGCGNAGHSAGCSCGACH